MTFFDLRFHFVCFIGLPLSVRAGLGDSDQSFAFRRACNSHQNGVCLAHVDYVQYTCIVHYLYASLNSAGLLPQEFICSKS